VKILTATAIAIVLTLSLTACGGNGDDPPPVVTSDTPLPEAPLANSDSPNTNSNPPIATPEPTTPPDNSTPEPTTPPNNTNTNTNTDATLIDNFEDGDRFNSFRGGTWFTYNDESNGGDSQIVPPAGSEFQATPPGAENSQLAGRITGQVTTTFPQGYIGMGTDLAGPDTPIDLREYDAIAFWVRGDGKQYRFKLHSQATADYDDYGITFFAPNDWERMVVPFENLRQEGWGETVDRDTALSRVTKIQWQTIGQPHESIELAVDNIELVRLP